MILDPNDVAELREQAEAEMTDQFAVYVPAGRTKNGDGMESRAYTLLDGLVPGRIADGLRPGGSASREVRVGGVARSVLHSSLRVPLWADEPVAGDLGVGWEYVLQVGGDETPVELVGSRWLVTDQQPESLMLERRLRVMRLPTPGGGL